ncbi:hypothetical protein [Paenibacillus oleatilyticus]|uniref:hypothetical protein n=1 Tax=Paenibacillus oleatilyticus TaxID=2594886 RepID=UPI001C200F4D|nr:hypothetical protein [Paenibacillus oleatilyticus]MBU7319026.1 hypothetical protein [Paenibacillus oleatilyticus]
MNTDRLWRHYKFIFKHYGHIEGVSRKTKKAIIGKKMSRKALRKRLAAVVITKDEQSRTVDISDVFCPRCGCDQTRSTGNMTEYPELWVRSYCLRCGFLVCEADNSLEHHALEFPEDNYRIH